ncbi:hypothetical protein [Sphingopyxis sp.]|uniref:hypothetical protein n=1 Tax=Sphingopyxis sp. TaxID=1908224 RepID=UPI002D77A19B|nr:hypothetical protein [Sphingopyxis sp.]HET6526674.1 hypothetical protein [Sphingopyxis sp.]
MTTSDWALIISIFSLLIALAGFVWNVWSKFIYPKPKMKVSFMLMKLDGSSPPLRLFVLKFTNFGPGEVVIDCAVARPKRSLFQWRVALGMLNPIDKLWQPEKATGPFAGGLPKKLAAGEEHSLYFTHTAEMWLKEDLEAVGVHDSFLRSHWASKADFRRAREQFRRNFPA